MTKEQFISLYCNSPYPEYIKNVADRIFNPKSYEHQKWLIDGCDVVNGEMVRKYLA